MSDPHRRSRRILKPGIQAQRKRGKPASEHELRRMFRDAAIEQRQAKGELTTKVVYSVHLDPPLQGEPPCVHSQRRAYFDHDRKKVAEVHYYLRPNGTIAASGLLDPKEVLYEGVLYFKDTA